MTLSILVPTAEIDSVTRRLERLAAKAGIEFTVNPGTTGIYWTAYDRETSRYSLDLSRMLECSRITIGDMPRVEGFTLLGKLIHTEAGNVISLAPGQRFETPAEWRTAPNTCDHCNTSRRRNDTFLVQSPSGDIRRIGRNCLADFLCVNPAQMVAIDAFQEAIRSLQSEGDGDGWFGGRYQSAHTLERYVAAAVSSIAKRGFIKRGSDGECTADHASFLCNPMPPKLNIYNGHVAQEEWKAFQPTPEHFARAAECIAWAKLSTDASDYAHNLRIAVSSHVADRRFLGLLASLPQACNRAQGAAVDAARKAAEPDAGHLGAIGERIDTQATLTAVRAYDSQWGGGRAITLRTAQGHEMITFTSGGAGLSSNDIGRQFSVRGTVKRHSEYKGRKQTELSRCRFTALETAETPAA